jgi:anti-sigma factor RsiW
MDCNEFVELVTAYLESALDDDTRRRFEEHLAECEGCELYLEQIRRTVQDVGTLSTQDVETALSPAARATLLTAFRTFPQPPA